MAWLIVPVAVIGIGVWPTTTKVGYNYEVTSRRLTVAEKAIWFIDRDLQMRRLTSEIAGDGGTPEQRLMRMYNYVTRNIHPVPDGWPVVDDHLLHVFVRGYGAEDQRAEALAALASYDGMPAMALGLAKVPKSRGVVLTIVQLGDRRVVFDVNNGIVFRKASGELATFDDLREDPSIIERAGNGQIVHGRPYAEHFARIADAHVQFVRMQDQQPLTRLRNELVRRLP